MAAKQRYKVLRGLNYAPGNKRAAFGSVVDDIPKSAIEELLSLYYIRETDEPLNRIDDSDTGTFYGESTDTQPDAAEGGS